VMTATLLSMHTSSRVYSISLGKISSVDNEWNLEAK